MHERENFNEGVARAEGWGKKKIEREQAAGRVRSK